jgi:hypothetical protein
MEIPIKADVICSDGLFGQSTHVILMPNTEEITHIVAASSTYPEIEYLVPIDHIVYSSLDLIRLNCMRGDILKMPVFNQVEFIPAGNDVGADQYMLWPYYYAPESAFIEVEKDNIPTNEVAIRRGAGVEATDGYIGHVDGFLMASKHDHITHIMLREGHLWGPKDIYIPVSQIDHYQDNTVYLNLDKHAIETQPTIPVWHDLTK